MVRPAGRVDAMGRVTGVRRTGRRQRRTPAPAPAPVQTAAEWATGTRARQGLPEFVEDLTALRLVADAFGTVDRAAVGLRQPVRFNAARVELVATPNSRMHGNRVDQRCDDGALPGGREGLPPVA